MENNNKENPTDIGTLLAGDMSDTLKLESDTSCLFSPRVRDGNYFNIKITNLVLFHYCRCSHKTFFIGLVSKI
ncbi:unnamed protein product, partial [Brassica rapa]